VDRLDYTKGIPERLKAYRRLLEMDAATHQRLTLLQVVVPSREDIPKYQELKVEIEQLISEINGHFGVPGWVPVQYIHRQLEREELLAYYRAADLALVTPLKDGMNLVCKEYCEAKVDSAGVLILSEFAGAAPQLRGGAVLVNPYDTNAVADAIRRALLMSPLERRLRLGLLRKSIEQQNVYAWCDDFIAQARASEERFRRMGAKVLPRRASAG
jgi:trehalose 6-phosphate synthase